MSIPAVLPNSSAFQLSTLIRPGRLNGLICPPWTNLENQLSPCIQAKLHAAFPPGPSVRDVLERSRRCGGKGAPREGDQVAVDAALEWVGLWTHRHRQATGLCEKNRWRLRFAEAVVRVWEGCDRVPPQIAVDFRRAEPEPWLIALCRELDVEGFAIMGIFHSEHQAAAWSGARMFRYEKDQVRPCEISGLFRLWRHYLQRTLEGTA